MFDSDRLKAELQVLYSDRDFHTGKDKLCDFIAFFKQGGLDKVMTEVYRLMCLIATIGVTSAGVERSFSCLKRLKTYTPNTIGQVRLRKLAFVAIERKTVKSLEGTPSWYDRVIDHFARKTRRAEFNYKVRARLGTFPCGLARWLLHFNF